MATLRRLTSVTLALLLSAVLLAGQLTATSGGGPDAADAHRSGGEDRGVDRSGEVVDVRLTLVGASVATRVRRALGVAKAQKGDAYKYGAEGPKRSDCSGLVYFATHRAGFDEVPRTSAEQGRYMRQIKRKKLRPGDFVFFTGSSGVYHVGVYVGWRDGDRAVVHAPKPGTKVRVEKVWSDSWFAATLRR